MRAALAKTAQPMPSERRCHLKLVEPLQEGIPKPEILALRGLARTLSERLNVSKRVRHDSPTLSRKDERWVFKVRDAAMEELDGLRARLAKANRSKRESAIRRLEREIGLKEEAIKLAGQAIVSANQGMLYIIARKVLAQIPTQCSEEDLVSAGNQAILSHAMDKFDWTKGFRFISYAQSWVRRDMVDEANAWRNHCKVTRYAVREQYRVATYVAKYRESEGEEPSDKEIAAGAGMTELRVRKHGMRTGSALSLDTHGDGILLRKIADSSASFEDRSIMNCELQRLLPTLPRSYQEILALRYGLIDGVEHTLEEIADILGCCKQNVGQKEARARKLLARGLEAGV